MTTPIKILFVGVFDEASTNYSQWKCLEKAGCAVSLFEYRKIAKKVGLTERDYMLLQTVINTKPDVLLIAKGNSIDYKTLARCNLHTNTVLWFMDTFFSWNKELEDKIRTCCMSVFAWKGPYERAKNLVKHLKIHHISEGYDPAINVPVSVIQDINISFIGDADGKRKNLIESCGAKLITEAYGTAHSVAVSRSRINLNFSRDGGSSDRVYKVLASKGFLLTEKWLGLEDEFENGKDLIIFENDKDLKDKCEYYLSHEAEMNKIREQGHNTVQKYTRLNWANKLVSMIRGFDEL